MDFAEIDTDGKLLFTISHWWDSTARITKHGLVWDLLLFFCHAWRFQHCFSRPCPIYSFIFKTGTENFSLCIASIFRLEAFLFCLKKWCSGDEIDIEAEEVLDHIDLAVLFEAVLESAPQFIIQLYAISVQEEPAAIIQIISLPISFLTLAWAFTATDKRSLAGRKLIPSSSDLNVKH